MRTLPLLALFCLAVAQAVTADETTRPAPAKPDQKESTFQYDGVWKPKGAMLGGVLLPAPALEAITLKIEKANYEVTVEGEDHSDVGTFTIDESTTPKRMTIKSTAGPNKGKTIFAIYEIKNADAMRVCYDLSGTDFPKEFKSTKGSKLYLVGYRRQIADAQEAKGDPSDEAKQ